MADVSTAAREPRRDRADRRSGPVAVTSLTELLLDHLFGAGTEAELRRPDADTTAVLSGEVVTELGDHGTLKAAGW